LNGFSAWSRNFSFDSIFWSNLDDLAKNPEDAIAIRVGDDGDSYPVADQLAVYEEIGRNVVDCAMKGLNASVMAYGQTGAGKSYTMMGTGDILDDSIPYHQLGLIPRILFNLFEKMGEEEEKDDDDQFDKGRGGGEEVMNLVEMSFVELYNEVLYDLIPSQPQIFSSSSSPSRRQNQKQKLKLRYHPERGSFLENVQSFRISSFEEGLGLVAIGTQNRMRAPTSCNKHSSRSHSILTIRVIRRILQPSSLVGNEVDSAQESGVVERTSVISLVDLAGSER